MTHECPIVNAYKPLPRNLFRDLKGDIALHGDIDSQNWWGAVGEWGMDILTLSAPCPPWSGASNGPGLSSDQGQLLPLGILVARVFRPLIILVEQVQGFSTHAHRSHCVAVFRHIGYSMKWHRVIEASDFGGARRKRWLAFAIRQFPPTIPDSPFRMWPTLTQLTPASIGAIFGNCPDADMMQLSEQVRAIASDPTCMSDFLRGRLTMHTPEAIMKARTAKPHQVAGTFMSMYGSQHRLDRTRLQDKGYMGHFLDVSTDDSVLPRYYHPAEICMIHLVTDRLFISRDLAQAWSHAGNAITMPHAMLLLANSLQALCTIRTPQHVYIDDVFMTMFHERLRAAHLEILDGQHGRIFVDPDSSFRSASATLQVQLDRYDELRGLVGSSFLPDGFVWFPDHGLIAIDACASLLTHIDVIPSQLTAAPATAEDTEELADSPMPTCPFQVMLKIRMTSPTGTFPLWVSGGVNMPWLKAAYGLALESESTPDDPEGCSFNLHFPRGIGTARDVIDPSEAIPVLFDGKVTICQLDKDSPLQPQFNLLAQQFDVTAWFDEFGPVQDGHQGKESAFLVDHQLTHGQLPTHPMFMIAAMQQVQCSAVWDNQQGHMRFEVIGATTPVGVITEFWRNILTATSLDGLGLQLVEMQIHEGNSISFLPQSGGILLPPHVIEAVLVIASARQILDAIHLVGGVPVTIRWGSKVIWTGAVHHSTTVTVLLNLLNLAYLPFRGADQVRLLCRGRVYYEITLQELFDNNGHQQVKLNLVFGMSGGMGAKDQHRVYVKNNIAATLLENGYSLDWTTQAVDTLMAKVGTKHLTQIVAMPAGKPRCDRILQFCRDAAMQVPTAMVINATKITTKGEAIGRARKKQVIQPSPKDYQIETSYLMNEDGTHPQQLAELLPNQSGVVLTDLETATPWIQENRILSHDELCLAIIGTHHFDGDLSITHTTLPCRDSSGAPVILATTLCQLGEKAIKTCKGDTLVTEQQCMTVSMTFYQDDWTDGDWQRIVQQPVPFLRNVLAHQGHDKALEAVWGKSIRGGYKDSGSPAHAVSLQLHGAFRQDSIHEVLRASGFSKVYMVPKTPEGRISSAWKVIWLEGSRAHLTSLSTKTNQCEGLVRSQKGMGLRYTKEHFAAAWKQLQGDKPLPLDVETTLIFRVQPLPFGTTAEVLHNWAKTIKWECRAIKALGPRSWLVGAPRAPSSSIHTFNTSPVLITLVPSKDQPQSSPILAGPKPRQSNASKTITTEDPWQVSGSQLDPWGKYEPTTTAAARVPPSAPARTVPGPIDARFSAHEDRLTKMEQALGQLKQDTSQGFQEVERREARLHESISQVRNDLETSFQQAISQQSQQLTSTLDDLKQLLTRSKRGLVEDDDANMG
eukprot:Skav206096  [mRNA]  locus=scaffold2150:244849:248958:- [translate_table: standard]